MKSVLNFSMLVMVALTVGAPVRAADTASYALDAEVKLQTDIRNRGISDSLRGPGARLTAQVAHESGIVGYLEFATVSKKQFLSGNGYSAALGLGYRFGDPDAWHFGVGAATELFPGASFEAPHAIDMEAGVPADVRRTKFDSRFAVLEAGYGALDARVLYVTSKSYRGIDTGGICGTLIQLNPDPTVGLACFARGDRGSRGTVLTDVNYKLALNPSTSLNVHAGYQRVPNFREANFTDWSVGVVHKHWGMEFTAEWLATHTRARELYLVQDGDRLRATDNAILVASVSRKF
ncbi:TorF family putative porin [Roseateles sp.]|uniref:TorF family putative porin n=1 Tax=Roseateles sp. TaxID=1971397 RepID=UPI0039EAB1EA